MKLCFVLPLLFLAAFTAAQTLTNVQANNTVWFVANVSFNPYLGHEYEGCWPNGTLTFSKNQSGSLFTASEWDGPACEDYNLTGGESFYIGNGNQYGYLDSNDSVQFNYNQVNSSMFVLNLWFGCDGNGYCDTTADVVLSLVNPNPCILYADSYVVNFCQISPSFNSTTYLGNFSFSVNSNTVPSCDGTQNVWGTYVDNFGECYDIATQRPNATIPSVINPQSSSLNFSYPVQQSQNSSRSFQFSIILNCQNGNNNIFSLNSLEKDFTSNVTTISLSGSSSFACPQPIGCPPVLIGNNYYNLCRLQQSNQAFFNISDEVNGYLNLNFGNNSLIPGCYPGNGSSVFATYIDTKGNCYNVSATSITYSESSSFQGLTSQLGYFQAYFAYKNQFIFFFVSLALACNASQSSTFEFEPNLSMSYVVHAGYSDEIALTLQGTSPYACPVTPDSITA